MKRREFLKTAAGVAAPLVIPRHVLSAPGRPGANDRIRTGVIGCGNRVAAILSEMPEDLQVTALADCNPRQMEADSPFGRQAGELFPDHFPKWSRYHDYRAMLDKEQLDAVFVTTTTHARALCCVHAVQAGVDVYAEKPLTLTIEEGQVLVQATRKYQRVLQVGTQARSMKLDMWGHEFIRDGGLGKVEKVVANNFIGPTRWTNEPGQPVPEGLDWDLWCNQAELRPYHPLLHRNWDRWWDYDGGGVSWGVTGWGTHSYDMVQASLGTDYTGPVEVWATKPGDPMSPVTMRYASGIILELKLPQGHGPAWGAIFIGERGKIETNRNKCVSNPPELVAHQPVVDYEYGVTRPHLENWIECMRSRQRPRADVEIAHRSHTICHLVNIARDLGRRLKWDPEKEVFVGDEEANRHPAVTRPRRKGYELPRSL
jgi:predicted dehydrogenase